jgi:hypothetical protein
VISTQSQTPQLLLSFIPSLKLSLSHLTTAAAMDIHLSFRSSTPPPLFSFTPSWFNYSHIHHYHRYETSNLLCVTAAMQFLPPLLTTLPSDPLNCHHLWLSSSDIILDTQLQDIDTDFFYFAQVCLFDWFNWFCFKWFNFFGKVIFK